MHDNNGDDDDNDDNDDDNDDDDDNDNNDDDDNDDDDNDNDNDDDDDDNDNDDDDDDNYNDGNDDRLARDDRINGGRSGPPAPRGRTAAALARYGLDVVVVAQRSSTRQIRRLQTPPTHQRTCLRHHRCWQQRWRPM